MNHKELLKKLEKQMARYGYCDTQTHIEIFIKAYEALTKDEKPIRLKDVIKRIQGFDDETKLKWTYDILQELGSDFGSKIFHEAYQQGKLEGAWVGNQLKDADKIRRELNKPVVPQFVADWYEENKTNLEYNIWEYIYNWDKQNVSQIKTWFDYSSNKPLQTLINMKQFGYEVEEEPKYTVKIKATKHYFAKDGNGRIYFSLKYESAFTKIELEKVNLGWVFDCEGVEVEEVTE